MVCSPPSGSWLCFLEESSRKSYGHAVRSDKADSTNQIGKLGRAPPNSRQLMRRDLAQTLVLLSKHDDSDRRSEQGSVRSLALHTAAMAEGT